MLVDGELPQVLDAGDFFLSCRPSKYVTSILNRFYERARNFNQTHPEVTTFGETSWETKGPLGEDQTTTLTERPNRPISI